MSHLLLELKLFALYGKKGVVSEMFACIDTWISRYIIRIADVGISLYLFN
jgi:hypothetical protein